MIRKDNQEINQKTIIKTIQNTKVINHYQIQAKSILRRTDHCQDKIATQEEIKEV